MAISESATLPLVSNRVNTLSRCVSASKTIRAECILMTLLVLSIITGEVMSLPYIAIPPNCGNIGYDEVDQYDCAYLIKDNLFREPSDGSRYFTAAGDGCNTAFAHGACALHICRSPDTSNDGSKLLPSISHLLAWDTANYLLAACAKSDKVKGKVTVRFVDRAGKHNELDIMLASIRPSGKRRMLGTGGSRKLSRNMTAAGKASQAQRFGQTHRRLLPENPPEISTYVDNGYHCIRRNGAPYFLRRECWYENVNGADLERQNRVDGGVADLQQVLTEDVREIVDSHALTDIVTATADVDGTTYQGTFVLNNPRPGFNYFGDLGVIDHNSQRPFYNTLVTDAALVIGNGLDIPTTNGLAFASFGVYSVAQNNNQNPSTGLLERIGTIIMQQVCNCG